MGATQVSVERSIAASADTVWSLVSDVRRMGEWSPETFECEWLGGASGPVVGARFRGRNRHGKKRWSTVSTVSAAEPGAVFAFDVKAGPLRVARWEYRFEPTDAGCRVTETWTDHRGRLVAMLGKPVSGVGDRAVHNRASMVATLDGLAAAAERTPE